jgi:hypothetical protein
MLKKKKKSEAKAEEMGSGSEEDESDDWLQIINELSILNSKFLVKIKKS